MSSVVASLVASAIRFEAVALLKCKSSRSRFRTSSRLCGSQALVLVHRLALVHQIRLEYLDFLATFSTSASTVDPSLLCLDVLRRTLRAIELLLVPLELLLQCRSSKALRRPCTPTSSPGLRFSPGSRSVAAPQPRS